MVQDEKTVARNTNAEGLTLVLLRNAFYRDHYKQTVFALVIIFFINVVLLFGIIDHFLNPPEPQYFAMSDQYQLIQFHPLSDPVFNNNYVLQWTADAVRQSFALDFVHWRDQLQRASDNFTPIGWHWFLTALQRSGNLDTLTKLMMVSSATITGSPVLINHAVLNDRYVWTIELPIMITYTNASKTIQQPLKIAVMVARMPVQSNPSQLAINQFTPVVQGQ